VSTLSFTRGVDQSRITDQRKNQLAILVVTKRIPARTPVSKHCQRTTHQCRTARGSAFIWESCVCALFVRQGMPDLRFARISSERAKTSPESEGYNIREWRVRKLTNNSRQAARVKGWRSNTKKRAKSKRTKVHAADIFPSHARSSPSLSPLP
jgi:hypothetical protein